ncbi:MAG: hypothetical protein B5766_02205 [Candidatus Lumbricidophila eiseniae]|uniref:RNase H type-1 domain-containing protein n=1 Tax=Candidatus Lumbricidiphila eiseniae TaxID=1969409 RepID=A0A2A6FTJ5_9MICO|nr:MAG: hypothetical protein B5766_02205 [Candidatus Lumbricidophila eiseniae]
MNAPLAAISTHPTVGLVITTGEDSSAWALITSEPEAGAVVEYHRLSHQLDTAARHDAMLTALQHAEQFAHSLGIGSVELAVYHSTTRLEFLKLGGEFGRVRVLTRSAISFNHPTYVTVKSQTHRLVFKPRVHAATEFVAATDGSFHPHYGGGAYAWVTDDGRHGRGSAQVKSPLEAELTAVLKLLRSARPGTKIHALLDSEDAIEAIEEGTVPRHRHFLPGTTIVILDKIASKRAHVDLSLEWVKGHNGHPLNDAADRLARLARQRSVFGTPLEVTNHIANGIVKEATLGSSDTTAISPRTRGP